MKHLVLALTAFTLVLTSCSSDDNDITMEETPNAVTAAFNLQFATATDVEYTKIGTDYEVDFDIATVDHEALFTSDGSLVKYKYDIFLSEVPQAIKTTVETDFENRIIDDTEILVVDSVNYYQLELENQPNDDKLVFNADGTVNTGIVYWD
ncbi:MAG: hypothetical protein ACTJGD_08560 [Mesonia hippocampi]|uniref:hypothetical protein n=1 Tax=Mesonia hippocampi TaxID=1628250 RepID=UPI003F952107